MRPVGKGGRVDDLGVQIPRDADGRRSSSALGRAVVADALRVVDPVGARAAEQESSWRSGYLPHLRRLVEAGVGDPEAALTIARDGLDALTGRLVHVAADGEERTLARLAEAPSSDAAAASDAAPSAASLEPRTAPLRTSVVEGAGQRETAFSLPYAGRRLSGGDLLQRLDAWVAQGVVEPDCADRVRLVVAHPEWLAVPGRRVVVLGAAAEMGPLRALLRWGADVAAVDLPRPDLWERLLATARTSAGTLALPVAAEHGDAAGGTGSTQPSDPARLHVGAGADLLADPPRVATWVRDLPGDLVVGTYVYADGADFVRVVAAADVVAARVAAERPGTVLAALGTPTDVYAVPARVVRHSVQAYGDRSRLGRLVGRPLRTASGGRLLQRAYRPGADPGIADGLVPQQGPGYATAKRMQRWRATVARAAGTPVSFHVAPATRTRSVVKNRALSAAYAGAHRFGVEVFEPATASTLMAALLVADLHDPLPAADHPWADEVAAAASGGLWHSPYAPRSALGLAAVLGAASART